MQIYQRHGVCYGHISEKFRIILPSRTGIWVNAYPSLVLSEIQKLMKMLVVIKFN